MYRMGAFYGHPNKMAPFLYLYIIHINMSTQTLTHVHPAWVHINRGHQYCIGHTFRYIRKLYIYIQFPNVIYIVLLYSPIYCKTSVNRPTMGPTLSGRFRKVICLRSQDISMTMSDRLGLQYNDRYGGVVDLWRWSVREVLLNIVRD